MPLRVQLMLAFALLPIATTMVLTVTLTSMSGNRMHAELRERSIPRLEDVAAIVAAQFGSSNFAGMPDDLRQWDVRSVGQLLLRTSIEYDCLVARGASRESAVNTLRAPKLEIPPCVLQALLSLSTTAKERIVRQIRLTSIAGGVGVAEPFRVRAAI